MTGFGPEERLRIQDKLLNAAGNAYRRCRRTERNLNETALNNVLLARGCREALIVEILGELRQERERIDPDGEDLFGGRVVPLYGAPKPQERRP